MISGGNWLSGSWECILTRFSKIKFIKRFLYLNSSLEPVTTMMQLKNHTKNTTLAKHYRLCRSAVSKARGLMFTSESAVEQNALVFEFNRPARQGMHMFFVFYPIDVVFLDEKKRVVDTRENFRPFTIYNSAEKSKYVIELPRGMIKQSRTTAGDVLAWQ
jgi:uncharacterized membrane protein (UPF0127 family)